MTVLLLLARWRLRMLFRAGIRGGKPTFRRCVRRPLVALLVLAVVGAQMFAAASVWLSDHHELAHPLIVALLLPAMTALGSAAAIVIVFYAFNALLVSFTDARALRLLLLAPISPALVMGERIAATSLGFSALLLTAVPALFAVGTVGLPASYDIAIVLVILALPVAPTSLAVLVLLPLLRYLPPTRARTIATFVGTAFGLLLVLGSRLAGYRAAGSLPSPPAWLPTTWPGYFIAASGTGDLATAVRYGVGMGALAAGAFALAAVAASHVFATGGASYTATPRRNRTRASRHERTDRGGRLATGAWALFTKDWTVLRRDPQRLVSILYPLAIIAFNAYQFLSHGTVRMGNGAVGTTIVLLMIAATLLTGSTVPALLNLEGRMLALLALAPVSPGAIFRAKWFAGAAPPLVLIEAALGGFTLTQNFPPADTAVLAATLAVLVVALAGVTLAVTAIWPRFGAAVARRQSSGFAGIIILLANGLLCVAAGAGLFVGLFFSKGAVALAALAGVLIGLLAVVAAVGVVGPALLARLMHSQRVLSTET